MKIDRVQKGLRGKLQAALLLMLLLLTCLLPALWGGNGKPLRANADIGDVMTISRYDIDMTVQTDRKVVVKERIVMKANQSGSKFTRSLPMEGNRYLDLSAKCVGEDSATYYVEDNDDYLNLICEIATPRGTTRTFELSYTMVAGKDDVENGMQIDVVGFGWTVPLYDVTVTMHFPDSVTIEQSMIARYGSENASKAFDSETLSSDKKTYTVKASELKLYTNDWGERVAEGIYVRFSLPQGTLDSFASTQIFTEDSWKIFLGIGIALALSILGAFLFGKKREISTTVNITAPDQMDPMKMGKLLDGNVDNEDVTSMIYYFAHKGYLTVDLSNEKDPSFTKRVDTLPEDAAVHERTLFEGLFKAGDTVRVSDLKEKFYVSVEKAKKQLVNPLMYEKKSIFGYLLGGLLALLAGGLIPFWLGRTRIGGGYSYGLGVAFFLPVLFIWLIGSVRENYRYKWRKGKQIGMFLLQIGIAILFSVFFIFAFGSHIMTKWEKTYCSVGVLVTTFVTLGCIRRTEKHTETLGQILGFKDFIVYTEAERIAFMLEENPTLYYKILPYAQVLGVTDAWEKKFKDIVLTPPDWCQGSSMTVFDYIIINRVLRSTMIIAMMRPASKGGSFVGRSGGGGSFGGFGGGGFGGGGGSWS